MLQDVDSVILFLHNITKDFNWDSENAKLLFEMTSQYGTPYFQNFVNSDLDPNDVRSMCCRLRLDKRELRKRGGGLFGSDEFTGSLGVVTINLPQIGYLAKTEEQFFARLDYLMDLAKESLCIKRKVIQKLLEVYNILHHFYLHLMRTFPLNIRKHLQRHLLSYLNIRRFQGSYLQYRS